jgi:hypothetical protein
MIAVFCFVFWKRAPAGGEGGDVKSPQPGGAKPPDSKIEDWWAQFETSIWDQVRYGEG